MSVTITPNTPEPREMLDQRAETAILNSLWARGRDFLGVEMAILGGAMSWASGRLANGSSAVKRAMS